MKKLNGEEFKTLSIWGLYQKTTCTLGCQFRPVVASIFLLQSVTNHDWQSNANEAVGNQLQLFIYLKHPLCSQTLSACGFLLHSPMSRPDAFECPPRWLLLGRAGSLLLLFLSHSLVAVPSVPQQFCAESVHIRRLVAGGMGGASRICTPSEAELRGDAINIRKVWFTASNQQDSDSEQDAQ